MRVVCISDTHARHGDLRIPDGDFLVHGGDITKGGDPAEVRAFDAWLGTLPHAHKVVIAGNHDFCFERDPAARRLITNAVYLEDEEATVGGLRFYGSPWQPRFFDWAFNADRGDELREIWSRIPAGVDVLVTHGPPNGILDRTISGEDAGCEELLEALVRVRPRLHVFGHIHEAHGKRVMGRTTYVNACSLDIRYQPVHAPIVIDL